MKSTLAEDMNRGNTTTGDSCDLSDDSSAHHFRRVLLDWYDRHRRTMPWRAPPGSRPDPYAVFLSEIMLQQTTVTAVVPYFRNFLKKWPTVRDLAAAPSVQVMAAWAGLGYYARARNMHKTAQIVSQRYRGKFPETESELKTLPGIGDYTAAAISSIAFNRPATVIDGNVERVLSRYYAVTEPLPDSKKILRQYGEHLSRDRTDRPGDFAQAMMDLGAGICTPKNPKCLLCPLQPGCAAVEQGIAADLPRRRAKRPKPHKAGFVYWIKGKNGTVLLERRPESAMLGGMVGFPTSEWIEMEKGKLPDHADFIAAGSMRAHEHPVSVSHSFTHFDLTLYGCFLDEADISEKNQDFFPVKSEEVESLGLPSLFKKFATLVLYNGGK